MNKRQRQRCVYPTAEQKKKLIELMVKHPQLVSSKLSPGFSYKDAQQLWQNVANQCNAIPGSRKTWRQWKKTWQDIRHKTKKRQEVNGRIPPSATMLTALEREALGLKNVSSTTNCEESNESETVQEALRVELDNFDYYSNDIGSNASLSEAESVAEEKVFASSLGKIKKTKSTKISNSEHSDSCIFNCDMLAVQEQKKNQIKEDYYTFKKEYLSQKLLLIREQTEALKDIAKGLSK